MILKTLDMVLIGLIIVALLGLIGFMIATFKIPNSNAFQFTKSVGGENIDEVIRRYIKFRMAKNRVYVYKDAGTTEEVNKKEETKEDLYE